MEPEIVEAEPVVEKHQTALARRDVNPEIFALAPVIPLEKAKQALAKLKEFVDFYLVEGEDYGTYAGVKKPSLWKSGAEKLCDIYGLADDYVVLSKTEDFDRKPVLFDYNVKCSLTHKQFGYLVATGLGSCNSWEDNYRYREAKRKCPECGKETVIKGKEEFGGGWLCFKKQGGCGQKWEDGETVIENQIVGKVENESLATLKNTVLKMAKKRSKIDAVLAATRSSGLFTQDLEDTQSGTDIKPAEKPQGRIIRDKSDVAPAIAAAKAAKQDDGKPTLKKIIITFVENGRKAQITGDCYDIKDILKASYGARWVAEAKAWEVVAAWVPELSENLTDKGYEVVESK